MIDGFCASVEACGSDLGKSGIQYGKALADTDFHGSMVSGVAAGRATSVALGGVAPKANVISINVKNGNNDAIIRAINWILSVKDKYKIAAVNLSAGLLMPRPRTSGNPCDFFGSGDQEISDGIAALYAAGIPFIIASGNDFQVNKVNFPSCIPQAITVGSVVSFVAPDDLRFGNRVGDIASYSNIGPEIDVLAPSEGIATASNNGDYMIGSGTSSAAPFIAGVIALLKQAKPTATVDEIRMALATTINYKSDIYYSNLPLVHLPSAINALVTSTYSDTKVKELGAKVLGDKAVADAKVASDKAKAAMIAQDKILAELAAANASLADSQKVNRDLRAQLTAIEGQFLALSDSVSNIQSEVLALNTKLTTALKSLNTANAKIKKICAVKPKPKGC